jgi:hypothetical protein
MSGWLPLRPRPDPVKLYLLACAIALGVAGIALLVSVLAG